MTSNNTPIVSVVMSVYNGMPHLPAAIDSILDQSLRDIELVVVDDGSRDESGTWLDSRSILDHRLRVIHRANGGLTSALNLAIASCKANLIARMDADDVAHPHRLLIQVRWLQRRTHIIGVGCLHNEIDADGKHLGPQRVRAVIGKQAAWRIMPRLNPFCHGSMLLRADAIRGRRCYDPQFTCAQDYELWSRLSRRHHLENIPLELLSRRYAPGMISLRRWRLQRALALAARWRCMSSRPIHLINVMWWIRDLTALCAPSFLRPRVAV